MTLKNLKRRIRLGIPLMMLVLFASAFPRTAEASYYRGHHGYRGYRSGHYGHGYGHYGYRYGYGHHYRHRGYYGYGHHYRPYSGHYSGSYSSYYGPTSGVDRDVAQRAGLGALDLNVRPKKKVEVYVDGQYVGVTGNFDGYPAYLWLKEGTHQLVFYSDGYHTVAREYTIRPGVVTDVSFRLEPGKSVRPEAFATGPTEDGPRDRD